MASLDWKEAVGGARVFHIDFFGSDHRVLHVVLDFSSVTECTRGVHRFLFEPLWRSNEEFRDVVLQAWHGGSV